MKMQMVYLIDDLGLMREAVAVALRHSAPGIKAIEVTLEEAAEALGQDADAVAVSRGRVVDRIRTAFSPSLRARTVVLADQDEAFDGTELARAGFGAVVPPMTSVKLLAAVIQLVAAGGRYFPVAGPVEEPARAAPRNWTSHPDLAEILTPRQMEIAYWVAQGLSNKEIALRLDLTEGTIKIHVQRIFRKLDVRKRTRLAMLLANGEGSRHSRPAPQTDLVEPPAP